MIELSFKHYGETGKAKLGVSPEFDFFKFEKIEKDMILMEGSLTKIIKSGKNKGNTRWLNEGEQKTVVTRTEANIWCREFEKETGKCAQCFGEGKVMQSWNIETGTKYRPCSRCEGTGKAA